MTITQDVIGTRESWNWMHRAPETPETEYVTPKQKRRIRKNSKSYSCKCQACGFEYKNSPTLHLL